MRKRTPSVGTFVVAAFALTWILLGPFFYVFLAVLAHLTFNTADAVVYGGLLEPSAEQQRSVYLVNVVLPAAIALAVLRQLAKSDRAREPESGYAIPG
jgi:hypothetical protein